MMRVAATTVVAQLAKDHGEGRLDERLAHFAKPKLLIIDELGYLPFEPDAAHLFFRLVSRGYERGAASPNGVRCSAILSWLITIRGDSYRLKENRRSGLLQKPAAAETKSEKKA